MLFIDRYPFHFWTDNTRQTPVTYWSARLPVILSDPGVVDPPIGAPRQEWTGDTGNTAEAFAWRFHLRQAGLNLSEGLWVLPHARGVGIVCRKRQKEGVRESAAG